MGRRGPPKTPTSVLALRGSWRAAKRTQEPKPDRAKPTCPTWLPAEAKAKWREIVPQLHAMGVLTKIDRGALARYCQTWALWRTCIDFLNQRGTAHPIKNSRGVVTGVRSYPQLRQANQLAEQLGRLEREFGLTPSARADLAVQPAPSGPSPFDRPRRRTLPFAEERQL